MKITKQTITRHPKSILCKKKLSAVRLNYIAPDTTGTNINYFYVGRIEDAGAYTNTADAPYDFYHV